MILKKPDVFIFIEFCYSQQYFLLHSTLRFFLLTFVPLLMESKTCYLTDDKLILLLLSKYSYKTKAIVSFAFVLFALIDSIRLITSYLPILSYSFPISGQALYKIHCFC